MFSLDVDQMSDSAAAQRKATAEGTKADAKVAAENWSNALELYRSALRIAPNHSSAQYWHAQCGLCLHELKRLTEAVAAYTKAIELDDRCVSSYINRGNSHFELENYAQALADFNKSLQLEPSSALGLANRALVWEHWKQWSAAIEDLSRVLNLTTDAAKIAQWQQRLSNLQACAASDASPRARKKRVVAAVDTENPCKRLKSSGADLKSEGTSGLIFARAVLIDVASY